jgi:hypothetical protein
MAFASVVSPPIYSSDASISGLALVGLRDEIDRALPIAPFETILDFTVGILGDFRDSVGTNSVHTSTLILSRLVKHVRRGRPAVFRLGVRGDVDGTRMGPAALHSLAATTRVSAIVQQSDTGAGADKSMAAPSPDSLLRFTCDASLAQNCVEISVFPSSSAIDGAHLQILRLSVAGTDVPLDPEETRVVVGFVHTPAPAGPVWGAAKAGDARMLQESLDDGGSTEERDDDVSPAGQSTPCLQLPIVLCCFNEEPCRRFSRVYDCRMGRHPCM